VFLENSLQHVHSQKLLQDLSSKAFLPEPGAEGVYLKQMPQMQHWQLRAPVTELVHQPY